MSKAKTFKDTDFGIYQKALFDRYEECRETDKDGEKGEHIWGLDHEILDAFADYMATHYGESILAIARASHNFSEDFTDEDKLKSLAMEHHDNLAINGEFISLVDEPDEFRACQDYKAELYGYKIVLWGVRVNGELI